MNYFSIVSILLVINNAIAVQNGGIESLWKITSPTLSSIQQKATIQLIQRLLPERVNEFDVVIDTKLLKPDNKDKFILESVGNKIRINATSGVSAANGFNYYLKNYANCHISWSGDQLKIATPIPVIKSPIQITIQDKLRYYQNVCTLSYSMVWWDFKRWEREIDWMAMRGINFPLAFNGQELIWRKVFEKFGLTVAEIDQYFSGPAFLAWNRMGNFQGWSGPLTENWHKYQALLQTKILERMRSFGMIPVLPAFAGHVPKNITRVMPTAKVSRLSVWGRFNQTFCCTTFLEPEDPNFILIGSAFIDEYKTAFGTDHFYNTDLFNEMTPRSKEANYLSDSGKAVYQSLVKSDPQAIWVMQGWLFHDDPKFWHKEQAKALITSVPIGKLLILDLISDLYPQFSLLEGYYGQPFIWCMLHNFGANSGLYGAFNHLNSDVFTARKTYKNMIGIGLTPEGIEQNDIIYDFMMETIWYTSPVDLNKWVTNYARRRYGFINEDLINAWHLLQTSVYTDPIKVLNHGLYVINRRPNLNASSVLWYKPSDVFKAFTLFVNASTQQELKNISTFQNDLVDITRQCLQLGFDIIYHKLIAAYHKSNQTDFSTLSKEMITILDDMNAILSTNENFLLGKWINSAKALANTDEEKRFNENQARNQVTIWGPNANILDYANKHWSGLVSDYYKPRWQLFIQYLQKSLTDKTPFNQSNFNADVFQNVELMFVNQNQIFSSEPNGDPMSIASNIHKKYENIFLKTHDNYYSSESIYQYIWLTTYQILKSLLDSLSLNF